MGQPAVLILLWMLQWRYVTTGGQRGTEASVFYAVEMKGGIQAVRALAEQHGLQFISRVSAYFERPLLLPPIDPQFSFFKSVYSESFIGRNLKVLTSIFI